MGNAKDKDYWNVPDDPGVRNVNWMQRLPSSTSVARAAFRTRNAQQYGAGGWFSGLDPVSLPNASTTGGNTLLGHTMQALQ